MRPVLCVSSASAELPLGVLWALSLYVLTGQVHKRVMNQGQDL